VACFGTGNPVPPVAMQRCAVERNDAAAATRHARRASTPRNGDDHVFLSHIGSIVCCLLFNEFFRGHVRSVLSCALSCALHFWLHRDLHRYWDRDVSLSPFGWETAADPALVHHPALQHTCAPLCKRIALRVLTHRCPPKRLECLDRRRSRAGSAPVSRAVPSFTPRLAVSAGGSRRKEGRAGRRAHLQGLRARALTGACGATVEAEECA